MLSLQVNSNKKLILSSIQLPSFLQKTAKEIETIAYEANEAVKLFAAAGFNGVFIQDTTPGGVTIDTIANLTAITKHINDFSSNIAIGTQMECDDAKSILAVAKASSLEMVRIKNFVGAAIRNDGLINGQGPETIKYKIENRIETHIFADIFNLTGIPLGNISLKTACTMAIKLGVSGLIICGNTYEKTLAMLEEVKTDYPDIFVLCGGNTNAKNIKSILDIADGVIVSSCLKTGKGFDPKKIKNFMDNVRG